MFHIVSYNVKHTFHIYYTICNLHFTESPKSRKNRFEHAFIFLITFFLQTCSTMRRSQRSPKTVWLVPPKQCASVHTKTVPQWINSLTPQTFYGMWFIRTRHYTCCRGANTVHTVHPSWQAVAINSSTMCAYVFVHTLSINIYNIYTHAHICSSQSVAACCLRLVYFKHRPKQSIEFATLAART